MSESLQSSVQPSGTQPATNTGSTSAPAGESSAKSKKNGKMSTKSPKPAKTTKTASTAKPAKKAKTAKKGTKSAKTKKSVISEKKSKAKKVAKSGKSAKKSRKVEKKVRQQAVRERKEPPTLPAGIHQPTLDGKPLQSSWKSRTHARSAAKSTSPILCQRRKQSQIWKRDLQSVPPGQEELVTCVRCIKVLQAETPLSKKDLLK